MNVIKSLHGLLEVLSLTLSGVTEGNLKNYVVLRAVWEPGFEVRIYWTWSMGASSSLWHRILSWGIMQHT